METNTSLPGSGKVKGCIVFLHHIVERLYRNMYLHTFETMRFVYVTLHASTQYTLSLDDSNAERSVYKVKTDYTVTV